MPDYIVIDTSVLQKTNAPLCNQPGSNSKFKKRLRLLTIIQSEKDKSEKSLVVLISSHLIAEYQKQIPSPRNDFIKIFMELATSPQSPMKFNFAKLSGSKKDAVRACRFPQEDVHVLRTAIFTHHSTILSEENRMLIANDCVFRKFGVHVSDPTVD